MKYVCQGLWTRPLTVADVESVHTLWDAMVRADKLQSRQYARAIVRLLTQRYDGRAVAWLPWWRVKRIFPRALEAVGMLGVPAVGKDPKGELERVTYWLAPRLSMTASQLKRNTMPDELGKLYIATLRKGIDDARQATLNQHASPKDRFADLKKMEGMLDNQSTKAKGESVVPKVAKQHPKKWARYVKEMEARRK